MKKMKNLYTSAIIIIGLLINIIPPSVSALEQDDIGFDFEFEMTFDEEEFNIPDPTEPDAGLEPPTESETIAATTTTLIVPLPDTTTASPPCPSGDSPQPATTKPQVEDTTLSSTATTLCQSTTTTQNTTTMKPSSSSSDQKLMVFCSLSLKAESDSLLITAKTQAKRTMDSIGFVNVSLCKYDKDKNLVSITPLDDMEKLNTSVYAEDNRIHTEEGYYYRISGYHSVSLSGKSKTIYNESEMVFAENTSSVTTTAFAANNTVSENHISVSTSAISTASNSNHTTTSKVTEVNTPETKTTQSYMASENYIQNSFKSTSGSFSDEPSAAQTATSKVNTKLIKSSSAFTYSGQTITSSRSNSKPVETTSISNESPPDTGDFGTSNAFFIFILSSAAVLLLRKHENKS